MTSEEAIARVAIADLFESYVFGVDGGPLADLVELFAEDGALVVHGGAEYRGRSAILAFLMDSRASRGQSPVGRIRHHVSRCRTTFSAPDRAESTSYYLALSEHEGTDHWGVYDDALICEAGAWRFAQRKVSIEGASPTGWIGSGAGVVKFAR